MSADNWAVCPQCAADYKKERAAEWKQLKDIYYTGSILPEQFVQEYTRLAAKPNELEAYTLREDYELGISLDGVFGVLYKAGCGVCNFSYKYEWQDSEGIEIKE